MEPLHPRIRALWVGYAAAVGFAVGLVLIVIDLQLYDLPIFLPGAVTTVLMLSGIGYSFKLYQTWRFDVEADALYLERGVITFVETAVPFVRVQHVDTQFGPVERLLGLSSVVVYTAGSRNADVRIPGLPPNRARELQNVLRELAVESEADDAV